MAWNSEILIWVIMEKYDNPLSGCHHRSMPGTSTPQFELAIPLVCLIVLLLVRILHPAHVA